MVSVGRAEALSGQRGLPSEQLDAAELESVLGPAAAVPHGHRRHRVPPWGTFAWEAQHEGDVARDIEAMLSDQCYEKQFLPRLRGLAAGMGRVALVEFKITGAHLTKANCSNETPGTKKIKESLWTLAGKTMGLR
ncbi:hypothetical protein ON010_g19059 [Phytophthora cinnamomi]|nr:hypothetical protein ON010_g19059 [Phytophthora cinnamomi]